MPVECVNRTAHGCIDIDNRLGWKHGTSEQTCAVCLSLDGPTGEHAEKFREQHAAKVVELTVRMTDRAGPDVLAALRDKHGVSVDAKDLRDKQHARDGWQRAKFSWSRAAAFAKSALSTLNGSADEQTRNTRWISCTGRNLAGEFVSDPCPSLRELDSKLYCGSCGCGVSELSRLDRKIEYQYLECPRRRAGFSNAEKHA